MRILSRSFWLALVLAGCGTTSNSASPQPDDFTNEGDGKAIKVTYLRFDQLPDARTRQTSFQHSYRVMLSVGWKQKRGSSPQEPFTKIYKNPFYSDSVPDYILDELVTRLLAKGLDQLRESPPDLINLEQLRRMESKNDPELKKWRVISIETETMKKMVTYLDNDDAAAGRPGAKLTAFLNIERDVLAVALANTIQVTIEKTPTQPR